MKNYQVDVFRCLFGLGPSDEVLAVLVIEEHTVCLMLRPSSPEAVRLLSAQSPPVRNAPHVSHGDRLCRFTEADLAAIS